MKNLNLILSLILLILIIGNGFLSRYNINKSMKQTEEVQEIARQSISQTKKVLHQRDSLFTELIKCRKK